MRRSRLSLALLVLFPSLLFAQQDDCRRRVVSVSVLDRDGLPVAGLTAENFRGEFRGAPVRIASANFDVSPKRMVIVLDLSRSMSGEKKFATARFIVAHAVASTPLRGQVAFITFAGKVDVIGGWMQERQRLADLIQNLNRLDRESVRGYTALWDAVMAAVDLLGPPRLGDTIYVVTDGGDNASHIRRAEVEKALLISGHRLFAFLVRNILIRSNPSLVGPGVQDLTDMAVVTGGEVLNGAPKWRLGPLAELEKQRNDQLKIADAAELLYKQMRQIYFVEFEISRPVDKPRSWKLELVADSKQQVKGFSLRYPAKLFPCSNANSAQPSTPD